MRDDACPISTGGGGGGQAELCGLGSEVGRCRARAAAAACTQGADAPHAPRARAQAFAAAREVARLLGGDAAAAWTRLRGNLRRALRVAHAKVAAQALAGGPWESSDASDAEAEAEAEGDASDCGGSERG